MGIKLTFTNNLHLSVFELLMYQNAKTNAKHTLWRKRITLPKHVFIVYLIMLPIKTIKYMQRTLCLGN